MVTYFVYFPCTLYFIAELGKKYVLCTGAETNFVELEPSTAVHVLFKERNMRIPTWADFTKRYTGPGRASCRRAALSPQHHCSP